LFGQNVRQQVRENRSEDGRLRNNLPQVWTTGQQSPEQTGTVCLGRRGRFRVIQVIWATVSTALILFIGLMWYRERRQAKEFLEHAFEAKRNEQITKDKMEEVRGVLLQMEKRPVFITMSDAQVAQISNTLAQTVAPIDPKKMN